MGKTKRIRLTKRAIEAIKPPKSGRVYVYDERGGGLTICVTSTGSRSWYVYKKINGRPERIRLGRWPELTVEQARTEAAKAVGAVASGVNPNDKRRVDRKAPTLGAVFDEFLELPTRTKAKRPKSAKTIHDYRYQFDTFLAPWRERLLSKISRADIERLHNRIGQDNGRYLANRVLALVKALFNTAIDHGYFSVNPAARLRAFEEESRDRFLQSSELPKFFAAVEAEPNEKIRDFIMACLWTGQRRSNVASMRWEDVDLEGAIWRLPQTKTGKHSVPLSTPALDLLRRRHEAREGVEYVFPGRHGRGHLKDPMAVWRDVLERAGIDDLRIHDLRRSLGSWQTKTGATLTIVGKTLGHTRPETTAIYSRLDVDPVRASVEAAAEAMLATKKSRKPSPKRKKKGS